MVLGHEKYMAFRTKFPLFDNILIAFRFTNALATFETEVNGILQPFLGIELVITKRIELDEDNGMVVLAYIDNILITTT
jgi:hypothetical protein